MKEYMNSYERCLAAIQFQDVDRMPTDLHNFLMSQKSQAWILESLCWMTV